MDNNIFNNIKQELENTVNADYNKLGEDGKKIYLDTRKKKIKMSYLVLISVFSIFGIVLFICGFVLDEGQIGMFVFSGILLVLALLSIGALLYQLKQPNEKLIKVEIRQRLMPDFANKAFAQQEQKKNQILEDFYADKTIKLSTGGWSKEYLLIDNSKKKFIHKKGNNLSKP